MSIMLATSEEAERAFSVQWDIFVPNYAQYLASRKKKLIVVPHRPR